MDRAERVSVIESAFLAMERPWLPMHVSAALLLGGGSPVTIVDIRRLLAARLAKLPRFRQRLIGDRWVPVRRMELRGHLFHHQLHAPGRMGQLNELLARIHEFPLLRDLPLWEMHLIDGFHGRDQAVLLKMHHAISDGIGGVQVAEALFDRAPSCTLLPELPRLTFAEHAKERVVAAMQSLFGAAVTAAGGPIALDGPFNGRVGPHRSFAVTDIPLRVVTHAKRHLGGTFDDVVVAIVAAGLQRYLRDIDYPDPPLNLRALLPVSTSPGRTGTIGNHVTAVFVDLPMHIGEMRSLVQAIATSKAGLRTSHAAAGVEMMVRATGILPGPLHDVLIRFAAGQRACNLVLSDVPAPDEPLFLLGRRITGTYPMMPLGRAVGLSIAVFGMEGKLGVGITADPYLVPSVQRVAGAIGSTVSALEVALRHHARAAA